ncbi:hypothetical protein Hanom_Chr00s000980g01670891 [Helianthus anomalus]
MRQIFTRDMLSDEEEFNIGGGVVSAPGFDPMAGGDYSGFTLMGYPRQSREYRRFIRFRQIRVGQLRALSCDALRECGK